MSRRSEGTSKQDLARSIIANAKAAGIQHFVLDFDGTIVANHFLYNQEYGREFYDQDPSQENPVYKTGLKPGITQAQAQGIFADFEMFQAILQEARNEGVLVHIASKQSHKAIKSVLERAGITEEQITGGIHGNTHIDGLKSSSNPSDPRGNGANKIGYMKSLVAGGITAASIFYADDAEEFGKKAIGAGLQDVTTFGCMNEREMLPLKGDIDKGRIVGDKIVGAGLDQSKWEMINAKFVEKVRSMQSARGIGGEEAQGGAAEAPRVPQRSGPGYERVRSATSSAAALSSAAAAPSPADRVSGRQLPIPPARRSTSAAAASASVGVEESAEEKLRREYLAGRAEVYGPIDDEGEESAQEPPVLDRSGKDYERARAASIAAAASSPAPAAPSPADRASGRQLPAPPTRRRSETAAASADVGVQESAEEKSRREYLARRAEVYGSIDDEEEVSAEAPPVPQRAGEFYERGRAASIAAAASSSADRVRRRQLPVPPARRRSETAADFMAETSLGDDGQEDAPPALAGYLARRGMMPSPVEQGGDDASQMSRIGGVQASLEESIDRYSQGYIALESFNPRISGFANFLDGLIETGRHNEAIMLVVLYGDQYLAPKQERVEGSPGRDFKDTKQFLKSSSDFIKSPAGVAALGQMLEEGLEFKDVMKVFASLKHVSNELNNKHLEEEKSQRRGTLSRAVGRLLSVSKRPPAAEASASGEQINFDCCETEIFTGFLSQLIERAEPANLLSLIKTLQTASEVSKSRPGDNSLFGLKDAIVLQKAITEYTKRAAPSLRPATTNVGDPSAVGSQAATHRSTPR